MALSVREFYLVMNDGGSAMALGDVAQATDLSFPNQESATAAATNAVTVREGGELWVVHCMQTPVSRVAGTTQVTVSPV